MPSSSGSDPSAPPLSVVARRDVSPPAPTGATIGLVRVSPDGKRIAYHCDDGAESAVYACAVDDLDGGAERATKLVALGNDGIDELSWSPDGTHLAYVTGGPLPTGLERSVGWTSSTEPGELGRTPGAAHGWTPGKPALVVTDLTERAVVHVSLASGEKLSVGEILDDGDVDLPPVVAVGSDGQHIAVSCRRAHDQVTEIWIFRRDAGGIASRLLTQIPGAAVRAHPFWSPKGKTLALSVVHLTQEQSATIAVRQLKGDGEILHHHELLDAPFRPSWAPGGRWIALFVAQARAPLPGAFGPQQLAVIDVHQREVFPLLEPGEAAGAPHFVGDRQLAVDGGPTALLLELAETPQGK
ncbi:MAG: PD40 domain-containing protein [Deltaproteobacteria bacterium]|nr:PD40 domain-containing protein [Deltaproteobacteria bacterium]